MVAAAVGMQVRGWKPFASTFARVLLARLRLRPHGGDLAGEPAAVGLARGRVDRRGRPVADGAGGHRVVPRDPRQLPCCTRPTPTRRRSSSPRWPTARASPTCARCAARPRCARRPTRTSRIGGSRVRARRRRRRDRRLRHHGRRGRARRPSSSRARASAPASSTAYSIKPIDAETVRAAAPRVRRDRHRRGPLARGRPRRRRARRAGRGRRPRRRWSSSRSARCRLGHARRAAARGGDRRRGDRRRGQAVGEGRQPRVGTANYVLGAGPLSAASGPGVPTKSPWAWSTPRLSTSAGSARR